MIDQHSWICVTLALAILQVGNFFRLADKVNVYSIFGREGMNNSSFIYLTLMAFIPLISFFVLIGGPFDIFGIDMVIEDSLLIGGMVLLSINLMEKCSKGIVIQERVEA